MTVDEVLQLIPEEQRDEAKQAIEGLNPLSSVQDADSALRLIEESDVLRRAKDKIAQQAVESHKRKFEEEKLPELQKQWKDEVRKELQPEETAEQKRLRELEETLKERDKREQMYQTKEKLRARAKEVGVDEDIAERFGQCGVQTFRILIGYVLGEGRQQGRPHGGGENAERHVDHALAEEQCRWCPFPDPGRQETVDDDVDLRHRHPQRGRCHEVKHAFYLAVLRVEADSGPITALPQQRNLTEELRHSRYQHSPGDDMDVLVGSSRGPWQDE